MESVVEPTEWVVVAIAAMHIILAPLTKVEESFNVQATHDLLFHLPLNLTKFDHVEFPGVVPRTFAGPIFLALTSAPMSLVFRSWGISKTWQLILIRFTLGVVNCLAIVAFCKSVQRRFGTLVADFLRMMIASQFHFLFYCSRPLPNTFALIFVLIVLQRILDNDIESGVRWATGAVFLFRCDLVLFFGPLFLPYIWNRRVNLFGYEGVINEGVLVASVCMVGSVIVDSYFWGKPVWPEGEVARFNIIENRSHEYGTSPFFWYFTSAIPRALMCTTVLVPFGLLLDRRLYPIVIPAFIFVALYSFLPHKELRFIIYVFPVFNLSAAYCAARAYINRHKTVVCALGTTVAFCAIGLNFLATVVLTYISCNNYPGGLQLNTLQFEMRSEMFKPVKVYIDNTCAQTGVSRFTQEYPRWTYNKTEGLSDAVIGKDFDFLVLGSYGPNIVEEANKRFGKTHKIIYETKAFHSFSWRQVELFPFFLPDIHFTTKAVSMKNNKYKPQGFSFA